MCIRDSKISNNTTPISTNGYDAVRCSLTLSSIKFTRFNVENKLHFPCIQYVTAKVAYSVEIAKHLTLAGVVAVSKFVKTKFPCNSSLYGFKTLFFINWMSLCLHNLCNYELQIPPSLNYRPYASIKTEIRDCRILLKMQCP